MRIHCFLLVDFGTGQRSLEKLSLAQTTHLSRRVFLTRVLYACQYPEAQQDYRTGSNPVRRDVHQVSGINQTANRDRESNRIQAKRHNIS
jgi:hypothetical protein